MFLFFGSLLLFLSIWKGPGGYTDLHEYLDDAERLWTLFNMAVPDDFVEVEDPNDPDNVIEMPRYNRYAVGLAVVSGPLVLLGDRVEKWTGREGVRRQIAAFTVPLLAAFSTVLVFLLGRELGFHARICHWAAIVFAFGSPFVTYTRLFFTEIAISFFVLLALWSFLRSRARVANSAPSPYPLPQGEGETTASARAASGEQQLPVAHSRSFLWLLLCGVGLGGAVLCHYGNVWITAIVWAAFSSILLYQGLKVSEPIPSEKGLIPAAFRVFAITLGPLLVLAGILWLNHTRYGHPLDTGYYKYDVENQIAPEFMLHNFRYAGQWLLRVPWIVLAVFFGRKLFAREPILFVGLMMALVVQDLFWMNYQMLGYFPYRYQQSLTVLCVPGLFFVGQAILSRWPKRGLWFAAVFLVVWNLTFVFVGDDSKSKPFLKHPQADVSKDPEEKGWLAYVWYMKPFKPGVIDGYGTPISGTQVTVFLLLLVVGLELLWLAGRTTTKQHRQDAETPRPPK
ncbi:MAG TPA: phospholipid carrier-dependent glycosyltransferase [Planctomycetota bacterium]|nr:phospholipid carrier-dependent glycosyltransferase [Planctomycetota bacterium]